MTNERLRQQIALEAARLMYVRQEPEFFRAKLRAARRICQGWIRPADLPTNREVREQFHTLARERDGDQTDAERADADRLDFRIDELGDDAPDVDRFWIYRSLLLPLESVIQKPETHPEGDALYHSLQVYDLARDAQSYDEEFQLAALLHDVGKAIDPREHVAAGLDALQGTITERTAWLIEHHSAAGALRDGTLGVRARRRLEASPDFDDLMLLCDCDRGGRKCGVAVPDLDEALEQIRALAHSCGG